MSMSLGRVGIWSPSFAWNTPDAPWPQPCCDVPSGNRDSVIHGWGQAHSGSGTILVLAEGR